MNRNYYKDIPCGESIPLNNPHAFSVSMPTIQDVIDYEEGRECSKKKIKTAYPRMVTHPYIKELIKYIKEVLDLYDREVFLLPNMEVAKDTAVISGTTPEFLSYKDYAVVVFSPTEIDDICKYYGAMKNCGNMIFSREAEDLLRQLKIEVPLFTEDSITTNPIEVVKSVLSKGYNSEEIILSSSGMNSIYTGFKEVKDITQKNRRDLFVLFGWAYADTLQILEKCCKEYIVLPDVNNPSALIKLLENRGEEVAAVYVETVSNPLIEVPDIPELHKLSLDYGFYLMVDNTFATPWCVDINSYCDIIFESLTKYASGSGDIMAGAIIIPKCSRLDHKSFNKMETRSVPLYKRDLERLAFTITGYEKRMKLVSKNSLIIEDELSKNKNIKTIYSVNNSRSLENWNKISINNSTCGVISIILSCDYVDIYNKISLPKGPSLGTHFPILMPYTLLAHYNQTKDAEGLENLKKIGLDPGLLRLSIGEDDPNYILNSFKKILG